MIMCGKWRKFFRQNVRTRNRKNPQNFTPLPLMPKYKFLLTLHFGMVNQQDAEKQRVELLHKRNKADKNPFQFLRRPPVLFSNVRAWRLMQTRRRQWSRRYLRRNSKKPLHFFRSAMEHPSKRLQRQNWILILKTIEQSIWTCQVSQSREAGRQGSDRLPSFDSKCINSVPIPTCNNQ